MIALELTELKEALQITSNDDDAVLEQLEAAAVAMIETYTGAYFGPVVERVLYSDGGVDTIYVRDILTTPAPVVETRGSVWTELVAGSDYEFIPPNAVFSLAGMFPPTRFGTRVTYSVGYEAGTVPDDIQECIRQLVAMMFFDRGKQNLKSETIGGYSYTRADGGGTTGVESWPAFVQVTLKNWQPDQVSSRQ